MIKHKMLVAHDPENGTYGDCHRICVATILGLDPTEVAHFYAAGPNSPPEDVHLEIAAYLETQGFRQVHIPFGSPLDDVFKTIKCCMADVPVILGSQSRSGCGHSVVVYNGEIFNDPSTEEAGIVGPMEDGYYWITFFAPIYEWEKQ